MVEQIAWQVVEQGAKVRGWSNEKEPRQKQGAEARMVKPLQREQVAEASGRSKQQKQAMGASCRSEQQERAAGASSSGK